MSTSSTASTYANAAKAKFNALKTQYTDEVTFWRLGYAFDTIIDYVENIDNTSAPDVGEMEVRQYQTSLAKLGGYDNAWFDDFGWWTIATQRAVEKPLFRTHRNKLLAFRSECWKRFTDNAPQVWARHKPGTYDGYRPAVEGGAWNEYWLGTSSAFPGPKDADPSTGSLQGIQNTVTNMVYLTAAQRLGLTDPAAKTAAEREYVFLSTWLWSREPGPWSQEPRLWWPQNTAGAALVRERVSHLSDGKSAPGFQSDWAWTGDQGLLLGALTDRINLDPQKYRGLLDRAKELLGGVTTLVDANGILKNWSNENVPSSDTADYSTGAGVFWRNALYAWNKNSSLKAVLSEPRYKQFLKVNADAAKNAAPTTDFNTLVNELAVLVAAARILG
ncbi:MAG: hypothetical protein EPN41_06995 [Candidimonas sp.]|nr:MAG: hypothetical protein EPN41_06995 [Candidimonas sp.]